MSAASVERGPDCTVGGIHVGGVWGESHSVMAGEAAPRVRAPRALNLDKESCEHLQ